MCCDSGRHGHGGTGPGAVQEAAHYHRHARPAGRPPAEQQGVQLEGSQISCK